MTDRQTTKQNIKLDAASTTADICKILDQCRSDVEIEECVSNIQHQENVYTAIGSISDLTAVPEAMISGIEYGLGSDNFTN